MHTRLGLVSLFATPPGSFRLTRHYRGRRPEKGKDEIASVDARSKSPFQHVPLRFICRGLATGHNIRNLRE
jgi:hypothetical protein